MGAALRLLVVLVTIATKWREYWLITACILASFTIGTPKPALAECSGSPDNVICTSGGNFYSIAAPGTPYQPVAGGINVGGNPPDPLGLTLKPGVQVVILSGGTRDAVNAANEAGCPCPAGMPVTILATDVTIDNTKNASDPFGNYTGLRIQSAGSAE